MININLFTNILNYHKIMKTNMSNVEFNIVPRIDETIMDLSYIKNGEPISADKLNRGIDLIDKMFSMSGQLNERKGEDKLGFSSIKEKRFVYSAKFNVEEYKSELENAKLSLKNLISTPSSIDTKELEKIQELLLKVSIPIWKEQVSILKPNHFKLIEL
jgi:hypothetical protein